MSAGGVREPDASVGLCAACRFGHPQPTARGAVFWRCRRAETDPRFRRYPPLPVRECAGFDPERSAALTGSRRRAPRGSMPSEAHPMRRWFVLTAIGRDRPGLVAELARLIYDSDANLEDSRMTILGTDFAVILLCSGTREDCGDRLAIGAKQLERDHGLTILLRHLEGGPRSAVPGPGTRLYRVDAAGEDRAGIVAGICGILAEHGVNIADLASRSRPGPGGSPHYELRMTVEVPDDADVRRLRDALESEADRLVIDVALMPA